MKKSLCLLLALLLTVFFCLSASAVAEGPQENFKLTGFRVSWPESFRQTKGTLVFRDLGRANYANPVLFAAQFDYLAGGQSIVLGRVFLSDFAPEKLGLILNREDDQEYIPLTSRGDMYYSYLGPHAESIEELPAEYREECRMIASQIPEALKSVETFDPMDPVKAFNGDTLSFETTDLDGNPVSSADLFQKNKITLVNLWGTWCPNCEMEMADLAQLHELMQQKDCGVVGVEYETQPIDNVRQVAKDFLNKYGITYPNVLKPGTNDVFNSLNAYPTSLFVDSNGRILGDLIFGARVDTYISTLESLLASEDLSLPEAEPDAAPAQGGVFTVTVTDGTNPIQGVMIKFCYEGPDGTCTIQPTDMSGKAVFNMEAGKEYEIEVLMAAGYEIPQEISKAAEPGELTLVLKKAE